MSSPSPPAGLPRASRLAQLFHHRWAVPVLAELHGGSAGGRFAPLARRLGVGRGVLRRTLAALGELGLARRNPGYGHPLRPEYLLTPDGLAAGQWSGGFVKSVSRAGLSDVALRKWSMPVLYAVSSGRSRFSEVRKALPGITARALALALRELQDAGLIERNVFDDTPPRVTYRAAARSRALARRLGEVPGRVTSSRRSARRASPRRS